MSTDRAKRLPRSRLNLGQWVGAASAPSLLGGAQHDQPTPVGNIGVSAGISERFLPGAKAVVAHPVGALAGPRAVWEQTEAERSGQIFGVDRRVPGVGTGRGARAPQEPPADAALVLRLVAADVVTEVQQHRRRLDPGPGRD